MTRRQTYNWLDRALRRFGERPFTAREIANGTLRDRDVSFLLVAYFMTDVERSLKFRIYRDELFRLNLYNKYQERSDALIEELFGSWAELNADFARWVAARRATFHPVEWGWEQDGDILQSYGWPNKGTYSQMDLQIKLRDKPIFGSTRSRLSRDCAEDAPRRPNRARCHGARCRMSHQLATNAGGRSGRARIRRRRPELSDSPH